ncbi:MAG TPA: hypothetical protein PLU35_11735 [Phycisphaerales bacterium]|nr:hypothetical protein [Phycisphaerales bacterium]
MDRERQDEPGPRPFTPFPEQDENGVDLTLLRENLRLTPLERARRAECLRRAVLRMHELANVRRHAKPS